MTAFEPSRDSSGFLLDKGPTRTAIWVESDRVDECIQFYRKHKLDGVSVSPHMGYKLHDLDFLRQYLDISDVSVVYASDIDIASLTCLTNLKSMHISGNRQALDISHFGRLKRLTIEWHKKVLINESCRQLRFLCVLKLKTPSKTLSEFPHLPDLQELVLMDSTIESLQGIGNLPGLRSLSLGYLPKLKSIGALRDLSRGSLEFLDCTGCRQLTSQDDVTCIKSLKVLRLNDCGAIPSLSFLEQLPRLEEFRFVNSDVIDGDLRPLLRLKRVGFLKKRHFSHTPEEIQQLISSR